MRALPVIAFAAVLGMSSPGAQEIESGYAIAVDETGSIRLPEADFRAHWTLLGSWIVGGGDVVDDVEGSSGVHQTYTQPGVVEAYRQTGEFPDGTVLVKELLAAGTQSMTTGVISHATVPEGWFVMVKDTEGRFGGGPNAGLWGDGWGWAFFAPDDPQTAVTTDYESECISCHVPARDTDWIYVWGYPVLKGPSVK